MWLRLTNSNMFSVTLKVPKTLLRFTKLNTHTGHVACSFHSNLYLSRNFTILQRFTVSEKKKIDSSEFMRYSTTLSFSFNKKIALVILNTSLVGPREHFENLWQRAKYTVCVDGGINELYKRFDDKYIPNAITGDFDSATKEILEHFKEKGVTIECTPDQDQTDFTKCILFLLKEFKSKNLQIDQMVAYISPQHMNRFDHLMANINTLYQVKQWTDIPLFLMSEQAAVCLLSTGKHELEVDTGLEGGYCGLIPVGEPCNCVTTTGLQWNLEKHKMKFGELISTSNAILPGTKIVTVETDKPLLWTMTVKSSTVT